MSQISTKFLKDLAVTNAKIANTTIDLTAKVTGALPVANGGTSLATLTANNVILGNGTSAPLFVAPGTSGHILTSNGTTWTSAAPATAGTVTSVAFSDGSSTPIYTVSGSPVTSTGTLTITLSNESANTIFAGPTTGGATQPTFRGLVSADIPNNAANTSGTAAIATTVTTTTQSGNTNYFLTFVAANSSSNQAMDVGPATYNPSTGLLTATGFSGSGASLTTLNASNLSSGTVPVARATFAAQALTETSNATTIDWSLGNTFTLTLNGNLNTVTFSNTTDGQVINVAILNTASNYTVTWGNSIKWSGGTQPVQTVGAFTDVWTIMKVGSTYYGSAVQNFS